MPSIMRVLAAGGLLLGVGALSDEWEGALKLHNLYRCMAGVPDLTWDAEIATNAQKWADAGNGPTTHSAIESRTFNGEKWGENMAYGNPTLSGPAATRIWYAEIQFTSPYGKSKTGEDTTTEGEAIGHYTLLMWKSAQRLGCGKGKTTYGGQEADFVVCQYGPTGNTIGQFETEVLPPTKTFDQCKDRCTGAGACIEGDVPVRRGEEAQRQKSTCTPNPLLPDGGLCVYGYQCASRFCCPRMKVCAANSRTGIGESDLKINDPTKRAEMANLVLGGACNDWHLNIDKCICYSVNSGIMAGRPSAQWDQSACGCEQKYLDHYYAGTWLSQNDIPGMTCTEEGPPQLRGETGGNADNAAVGRGGALSSLTAFAALVLLQANLR